jgi:hypothetical protein
VAELPAANKVVRVELIHTYGEDTHVVTRPYFQYAGTAPTGTNLNTWATTIADQWAISIAPECSPAVVLTEVICQDLTSDTSPGGAWGGTHVGTRAGSALPASTAAVAGYLIGRRYRGGHPRGYWPLGVSGDLGDPQTWASTSRATFESGIRQWIASITSAAWSGATPVTQCNVSYYKGNEVVIDPITGRARNVPQKRTTPQIDPVASVVVRSRPGNQRRREEL